MKASAVRDDLPQEKDTQEGKNRRKATGIHLGKYVICETEYAAAPVCSVECQHGHSPGVSPLDMTCLKISQTCWQQQKTRERHGMSFTTDPT